MVAGQRVAVASRYLLKGTQASFEIGAYDATLPLVIDPSIVYSTFAGGSSGDYGRGITVDAQGNAYVVGDTLSSDFLGYDGQVFGSYEALVLKFNPSASDLVWGSIIGGSSSDQGLSVAVNSAGEVYATVDADSTDFPIQSALFSSRNGTNDGAMLKYSASGQLLFSSWLPFNVTNTFTGKNIAVDSQNNVIIAGQVYTPVPTSTNLGLLKINSQGTQALVDKRWTTSGVYVTPDALALGPGNSIYLTGTIEDRFGNFTVTNDAIQPVCGRKLALGDGHDCDDDAYIVILDTNGNLTYASYLGGLGDDEGRGIAVAPDGSVAVVGTTFSPDFPTTAGSLMPDCNVDQSTGSCYYDTFVTRLSPGATDIQWSTYLASDDPNVLDFSKGVAFDTNGNLYALGYTAGQNFPTVDPIQGALALGNCSGGFTRFCFDITLSEFDSQGGLVFSTYLGGNDDEYAGGLSLDPQGNIYLTGYSYSNNYPSTNGVIQPDALPGSEFFVTKIGAVSGGGGGGGDLPYSVFLPLTVH